VAFQTTSIEICFNPAIDVTVGKTLNEDFDWAVTSRAPQNSAAFERAIQVRELQKELLKVFRPEQQRKNCAEPPRVQLSIRSDAGLVRGYGIEAKPQEVGMWVPKEKLFHE
jgi:hypothetical protein